MELLDRVGAQSQGAGRENRESRHWDVLGEQATVGTLLSDFVLALQG